MIPSTSSNNRRGSAANQQVPPVELYVNLSRQEFSTAILTQSPAFQVELTRFNVDLPDNQELVRRRRHAEIPITRTYRNAITIGNAVAAENNIPIYNIGNFEVGCIKCGAKYFEHERTPKSSCCKSGNISLEPLGQCPAILLELLTADSPMANRFRENIRAVNSLFAMATFKANIPPEINPVGVQGHWCFTVCGQVYHYCQPLPDLNNIRANNSVVKGAQYYFLDAAEAVERRNSFLSGRVPADLIAKIEVMLRETNVLIRGYMTISEIIREKLAETGQTEQRELFDNLVVGFKNHINIDVRNFNLPESRSEVAAVFVGEPPFDVNLKVYPRDLRGQHELKNLNSLADPMVYPLLFPYGELGHDYQRHHLINTTKNVTFREHYRYRIHLRESQCLSILHNGGKLFQQYLVDAYIKVESNELWWYKTHRRVVRRSGYDNLLRYLQRRASEENCRIGNIHILPSTFRRGYRFQNRQYLDALNIIARFGKPDLFITFTCNPSWPEIVNNLKYKQKWQNRPELICRTFYSKFLEFLDDITKKQLYGTVQNFFYVIEFQKRGLPHAHLLVTFYQRDKLQTPESVDSIISAIIPDVALEPQLYSIIAESYLHKKCLNNPQAACYHNGICSKGYPKPYNDTTRLNYHLASTKDGRPEYRRPDDGRLILSEGFSYTSIDIVPYNRYATLKYKCHINFEGVGSLASVKYLHKYVTKGDDMCRVEIVNENERVINWDEITTFLECRYISSVEACWRLFEFKMADHSHTVMCLPVHLENRQIVEFEEDEDEEEILNRVNKDTKLTAFFKLNAVNIEARNYRYVDIPEHFVWDNKHALWNNRTRNRNVIGAIVEISPALDDELYCLRILLQHTQGPTSFADLKKILLQNENSEENVIYCNTFKEACLKRGLFTQENFYEVAIEEACQKHVPRRLRNFYALIILVCIDVGGGHIDKVLSLWHRFKNPHMIADYFAFGECTSYRVAYSLAIRDINSILKRIRSEISLESLGLVDNEATSMEEQDNADLDHISEPILQIYRDAAIRDAIQNKEQSLLNYSNEYRVELLNSEQKLIYNKIIFSLLQTKSLLMNKPVCKHFEIIEYIENELNFRFDNESNVTGNLTTTQERPGNKKDKQTKILFPPFPDPTAGQKLFFVDGPAGTGKTFLYNVINAKLLTNEKLHGMRVMAVAWTGIAASLIRQGQTCHKGFKMGLDLDEFSKVGWPVDHENSYNLKSIDLILWDEVSMTSRYALEAVDCYIRDLSNSIHPFGGKTILFGGDFRQTLPVVVKADKYTIINRSVLSSALWRFVLPGKFHLVTNLRAQNATNLSASTTYAEWLIKLGNGEIPFVNVKKEYAAPLDLIKIPEEYQLPSQEHLINFVFGGLRIGEIIDFGRRVILCPTNQIVREINTTILNLLPGNDIKSYYSIDEQVQQNHDKFFVPLDILNSIETANLPPHDLKLKVGAVVMLLRNIDVAKGQCNGCRFIVRKLYDHRLEIEALTGASKGTVLWLPKVMSISSVPELAMPLKRTQFPVKLAFAMTINKSQGQTFEKAGIYLHTPCFTHGQLYVAFSRVGDPKQIKVFIQNNTMQGQFAYRNNIILTRNVVYKEIFNVTPDANLTLYNINRTNRANIIDNNVINYENDAIQQEDEYILGPTPPELQNLDFDSLVRGKRVIGPALILPKQPRLASEDTDDSD